MIDAQAAIKADPCEVLAKIAQFPLSNADQPLYDLLFKHGLALPLPFSWAKAGKVYRYPYLNPKEQLEVLSENYFHRVLGVPVSLAEQALAQFWAKFRSIHPNHDLFRNHADISFHKLIPYYLHGDGGRGFKKDPIEIMSMFPALGSGSRSRKIDLNSKRKAEGPIELGINLTGNSGATRFMFTVLSSLVGKNDSTIFDDLMAIWARSLKSLFEDGFQAHGSTWRIMILGFTGDSPFVKKVGKLTRSFNNVRKAHTSTKPQKGCCWLCHAGYELPAEEVCFPFEHLGYTSPKWLATTKLNNPAPWVGDGGALLPCMLLDRDDTPAAFFRADFFHVFHAGVGKDFVSSALMYAIKALFGLGSVSKDMEELNARLNFWMKTEKKRLHCGHLTEDLLGYSSTREFPEGKWSKNMDSSTLMGFIVYLLQRPEFNSKVEQDSILKQILSSANAMGRVVRTALGAEFFMSSEDCEIVAESGHEFLLGYADLVAQCHARELCLFKLRPKVHYLNHIFLRVYEEWLSSGTATNPLAEATFMSEDFVGRTARLSRKISTRAVATKTLQRYLLFMKTCLDKDTFTTMDFSWLD